MNKHLDQGYFDHLDGAGGGTIPVKLNNSDRKHIKEEIKRVKGKEFRLAKKLGILNK